MADHFDITQTGFSAEPEVIIKQNDEKILFSTLK